MLLTQTYVTFQTIQVGSDFQAVIPGGLSVYGDAPAYENEDRLLWDPSKTKDEQGMFMIVPKA